MKILNFKFQILIFLFSFLILTKFNIDPDLGWHLATGSRFLASGEIMRLDQFSWTMPDYQWGNPYFAYQILLAFLSNNFSYPTTAIIFGILGSVAILILLPRKIDLWRFIIVLLAVAITTVNLGVRPHMISFLFFAILLKLLEKRFFKNIRQSFFWLIFFAIWANFHQGFLIGLLIFGAFLLIDFLWQKSSRCRILCFSTAIFGTLMTPFNISLWKTIILDLSGSKTWFSIAEWQPTIFYFPVNLIYALSAVIFIYLFHKKIKQVEPAWFLIAAFLFMLGFLAVNFVSFWALALILVISRYWDWQLNLKGDFWGKLPLAFSLTAVFGAFLLSFLVNLWESKDLRSRLTANNYPVKAVDYLKANNMTDGLFNEYGWGGYIDWQFPQAKVFIDGRMTGWRREGGQYILSDYMAIVEGKCQAAQKYNIEVLLVKSKTKTACFEDWQHVYQDQTAKVFVKPGYWQ